MHPRTLLCLLALAAPAAAGLLPLGPPLAPLGSPAPDQEALEVRFEGAGGLTLTGTLVLPAERPAGGVPALVLLAGSGPTDRDGNQIPYLRTDLLKQIAERLAQAGVATLRYDKRAAQPYHEQIAALDLAAQQAFFGWDRFVGDARAALAWLRARPEVDAARAGFLGHSEGGLYALQAAADLGVQGSAPAALVLVATCGRPLADVVHAQIEASLASQDEALRTEIMGQLERAIAQVIAEGTVPENLFPGLEGLFPANAAPLLKIELATDPLALARRFEGPVLLLAGEKDVQVPADVHVPLLREVLAARPRGSCDTVVVPAASHNLKRVETQKDLGFVGPVVPEALDALAAWVPAHLAPAAPEPVGEAR